MMQRIRAVMAGWAELLRAVAGAPDYRRYLAHMRATHPGDRIMTETEFDLARMSDRYDRAGSRCC